VLRLNSSKDAAENAVLTADYTAALVFFDKHREIADSTDYRKLRMNTPQLLAESQIRILYCKAEIAAAAGDWDRVHEFVSAGLKDTEMPDVDLVILAHRLCKEKPDVDPAFKEHLKRQIQKLWMNIGQSFYQTLPEKRRLEAVKMCNQAAWMLANLDGDYASALALIETALKAKPDDCSMMDTLAHVYFLGGRVEDAIQTQEKVVLLAPEATLFRIALDRFKQGKK
jgi:tetratricopeptide (TPR) repeat protein